MSGLKEFFSVDASKYDRTKTYKVVRPASLSNPQDNAVMFVTEGFLKYWEAVLCVKECIVIWPENHPVPAELAQKHAVILSKEPRYGFAQFFYENHVTYNTMPKPYRVENGAMICEGAQIGEGTIVFPGAYVDGDVKIGKNCYTFFKRGFIRAINNRSGLSIITYRNQMLIIFIVFQLKATAPFKVFIKLFCRVNGCLIIAIEN